MFGISETELLIIIVFGFLVFGPDKLPGMGRTLGRMLRQFREAQQGFTEVVQTEVMDPLNDVLSDPLAEGAKGTKKDRAAALAEDSDIELPEGATAPKRETFAERKARLAAEREAAAAAAAAAEAQEETDETEVAEANEAMETTAQEPESSVVVESEEPDTSANALYALGGRTSGYRSLSQKKADEAAAKAEAEAEAKAADAVEKADAPAPELDEPAIEAVPAGPTKVDEGGEGSAKA